MYCNNCGTKLNEGSNFCANCGKQINNNVQNTPVQNNIPNPVPNTYQVYDSGSFGWAILGFIIPLVGFILYFCWRANKPKCAEKALWGGVVGFCINLILSFM